MTRILAYSALIVLAFFAQHKGYAQDDCAKKAPYSGEQSVRVDVSGAFGTLFVKRGESSLVYSLQCKQRGDDERDKVSVSYGISNNKGILRIELNTDAGEDGIANFFHLFKGKSSSIWYLELTDRVPVAYHMELGAGEANLDFSGMRISDLRLEAGASSVTIRMLTPNPETIKVFSMEAGVGSVASEGLGNLNFERLRFEGGLGSYALDLSGALRDGARISTEVGLGSLDITLPEGIGARARCDDSFLSSSNLHRFTRMDDDEYETPDYDRAKKRVRMNISSGLGSVAVRWKK